MALYSNNIISTVLGICGGEDDAAKSKDGNPALHEAVKYKELAEIKQIINNDKSSVRARNEQGLLAIHWAAHRGDCTIAQELIENGSPIDNKDLHGFSPLCMAAMVKHKVMTKLLIKQGASTEFSPIHDINTRSFIHLVRGEIEQEI